MLQVFYLDVAVVIHIYCKLMFQMFHLIKCFMLQVFSLAGKGSDGRQSWCPCVRVVPMCMHNSKGP
jgi:hypothetical protein